MTDFKQLAIEKLATMGAHAPAGATIRQLAEIIEMATGTKRLYCIREGAFVEAFAVPPKTKGQQFNLMTRKTFGWHHPRAAEIDQAQPPMMTPNGIGNDKQPGGFLPVVHGRAR
ncbi:MAG TPA: hypothetical protein VNS29_04165 [Burkholderiaceae bacterium]|nr:hypothetical protein [Burkholderiaceae bacterium]